MSSFFVYRLSLVIHKGYQAFFIKDLDASEQAAKAELGRPFAYEEEINRGIERQAALNAELNLDNEEKALPEETKPVFAPHQKIEQNQHPIPEAEPKGMSEYSMEIDFEEEFSL